ncbi:MAG TPA: hypothetical protein VHT05_02100 [Candidatus Elarobacter sp.]|nr:hypothetical protein [Candidatus Elarobacter sp.]
METVVHVDDGIGRDKKSSEVFAFADAGPSLGLSMRWVSPSRLLIVIKEDPRYVEYQVVKAMGVDISLKYDGRSSAGGIRKLRTSRSSAMTNV